MSLPNANTPLYNHALPNIEQWLISQGCQQDNSAPHCWHIQKADWKAELCLEVEDITVRYFQAGEKQDIQRAFKYSLSRQDIEQAVFAGP